MSGCGGTGARLAAGGTRIGITESDFHIASTRARVPPGPVVLRIHNQGPDEHELIVAPARKGGLPMRSDGFTIDEGAIESSEAGSIVPQHPGGTEYLRVVLSQGRYVLFCNMEGHYMGGMSTVLVVG